ncbi:2-oxoglutarate and iron-dependent oxygenase domain-containing protein [Tropicimonas sp. TH_r6]|uniref:isopenicillin N synthase family dioxygenase n=1 Tax=Tropicimonas sp. TH_r6 TaxID=3082085 RepID=UPI002953DF8E|nr:2-oxoglutarate and iron-dependent oxygenase domain-containing protein [Tropicimonas sp. TH_r6]MDV7141409.1 2-oxoglutarate and iron-dependent oxygenase domain-containing protein [Tropicimonas sp. TH_r6]
MIPKLDWRRYGEATDREGFVDDLGAALRGPGILRLSNHGIPTELSEEVFHHAAAFFDLTEAEKRTLAMQPGQHNRGWTRMGAEQLADGASILERREGFNIGLELPRDDPRAATLQPFRTPTPWPMIRGFREATLAYFDVMLALGTKLQEAIALDLGLPANHFAPFFSDPLATLRLVTYPPATGVEKEIGAGAHTDYGSITLLNIDTEPGLQARLANGDWVDVDPEPGCFVLLVGDCLECWSGGRYRATPHRVQTPKNRRYAINFYLDPGPGVPVAPLPDLAATEAAEGRAKTYAAYLTERLAASHMSPRR